MSYAGWSNYPTWAINLWLLNDEGLYDSLIELVRTTSNDEVPSCLRAWIEEMVDELYPSLEGSFGSDLMGWAIEQVDWQQLAEAYLADFAVNETSQ